MIIQRPELNPAGQNEILPHEDLPVDVTAGKNEPDAAQSSIYSDPIPIAIPGDIPLVPQHIVDTPARRVASLRKVRWEHNPAGQNEAPRDESLSVDVTAVANDPNSTQSSASSDPVTTSDPVATSDRITGDNHQPVHVVDTPVRPVAPEPRRRKTLLYSSISSILVFVVLIAGIFSLPGPATTIVPPLLNLFPHSHVIKIAVDMPLSGMSRSSGQPVTDGANFALDQVKIPGYTIEYEPLDDQANPNVGKANITEAINDPLTAAIIGPYNSSVAQQEMPVTNTAPIAQLSPVNTNPCLTQDTKATGCTGIENLLPTLRPDKGQITYFRLPTTDDLAVKVLAKFLTSSPRSYKTAYVFYNSEDPDSAFLQQSFAAAWKNAGGTFAGSTNALSDSSPQQYVDQFQPFPGNTSPDVVFFAGTMPAAMNVKAAMAQVPQLRKAAFVASAGIMLDSFVQAVQRDGGGPVFASTPFEDTSTIEQFKINYFSSGYGDYGPYTASANDSALIITQAIKTVLAQGILPARGSWDMQGAKTFRQAIIHAIANISRRNITSTGNLSLATNFQSFDQNGDNTNPYISIYSLSGNSWQLQESDKV